MVLFWILSSGHGRKTAHQWLGKVSFLVNVLESIWVLQWIGQVVSPRLLEVFKQKRGESRVRRLPRISLAWLTTNFSTPWSCGLALPFYAQILLVSSEKAVTSSEQASFCGWVMTPGTEGWLEVTGQLCQLLTAAWSKASPLVFSSRLLILINLKDRWQQYGIKH